MAGHWVGLGPALLAVSLIAGCGTSHEVGDVERRLVERYVDPLAEAGITTAVQEACRYRGSVDLPWHLSVMLRVQAPQSRTADVLEGQGMVVLRDRNPMIVQQIRDNPSDGWNGTLAASGDGSLLTLVYNNAVPEDRSSAVGWAEECP